MKMKRRKETATMDPNKFLLVLLLSMTTIQTEGFRVENGDVRGRRGNPFLVFHAFTGIEGR